MTPARRDFPAAALLAGRRSRRETVKLAAAGLALPALALGQRAALAQDETYQVAYLTPGLNVPFWKYLSDGIKQQAETDAAESGASITVTDYDSRNDAGTQLQNAQDAITAGVNLIILSPTDSSSAPTVLELAAENNVPVVIADIGTDEGEYVSFVISTNEQGAYEAGQVLVERMQANGCEGGDIAMVTISQARLNGQNRTRGSPAPSRRGAARSSSSSRARTTPGPRRSSRPPTCSAPTRTSAASSPSTTRPPSAP
jgi:ABC-type sugar transport system substrate-binding protein